jgi:hypothetical protein
MKSQLRSILLIIVLALILTLVGRDFMNRAIVSPLLYFYWVGRLIFASIPQGIIWGIFVVGAGLLAWPTFIRRPARTRLAYFGRRNPPGRIETWQVLIGQAKKEPYYRWKLAQNLRTVTLNALAHDERLALKVLRQRLASNELGFPPEIQAYFQASTTSFGYFTTRRIRFLPARPKPSALDLEPHQIVEFLEERFNL